MQLVHLLPLFSAQFKKAALLDPPHATSSVCTSLHLRSFQGVQLLKKFNDALQAELGQTKDIESTGTGPQDVIV